MIQKCKLNQLEINKDAEMTKLSENILFSDNLPWGSGFIRFTKNTENSYHPLL